MANKIVVKKRFTENFLAIVDSKLNALQHHPFIGGHTHIKNVRGIHVTMHNRMYYRVRGHTVTIINLFDTGRKSYGK